MKLWNIIFRRWDVPWVVNVPDVSWCLLCIAMNDLCCVGQGRSPCLMEARKWCFCVMNLALPKTGNDWCDEHGKPIVSMCPLQTWHDISYLRMTLIKSVSCMPRQKTQMYACSVCEAWKKCDILFQKTPICHILIPKKASSNYKTCVIITYDHHVWSSDMIIIYVDHIWSSYMIIMYEHYIWSS